MIYKYGIISPNLERSCFSSAGQLGGQFKSSLSIIEWPINFNNWKEFLVGLTLQMLKIFKLEELTALKFLRYKSSLFHLFSECHSLSSYTVPNHTLLYFTVSEVNILRLVFNFIYYLWVSKIDHHG